jgi:predicted transcriptional regulator of viral defense system
MTKDLYPEALELAHDILAIHFGYISIPLLQRYLRINYQTAKVLLDRMDKDGWLYPIEKKLRRVREVAE